MTAQRTVRELHSLLQTRRQLRAAGVSDRGLRAAIDAGALHRLSPGVFVEASEWKNLGYTQQHILLALCAQLQAAAPLVFSHRTAAMLHRLPLLRSSAERVHTLQAPNHDAGASGRLLLRHRLHYEPSELVEIGGLVATDVSRTVLDVARSESFENGVLAGDEGLRREVRRSGESYEELRSTLRDRLEAFPTAAGLRRARNVLSFLDEGAESPLESLYRIQFARLGFQLRTQVAVPSPGGGTYRVDIEIVGHRTFFEADGRAKYLDANMRNGKSLDELLLAEREREVHVQGRLGYRMLRGGWEQALTTQRTAALLRRFGLEPPHDFTHKPLTHVY